MRKRRRKKVNRGKVLFFLIAGLVFGFWLLETVKNRPSVLELGAEALDAASFPQTGEK